LAIDVVTDGWKMMSDNLVNNWKAEKLNGRVAPEMVPHPLYVSL
jgi:hypothetical protein